MADYFQEMGWRELEDGERPDLLAVARFLIDYGVGQEEYLNGQWPRLPPPASKQAVNDLPDIAVVSNDRECPICLKKLKIKEMGKQMPCSHFFHSTCILTWLDRTNSCPVCRHELLTDDVSYEEFKKAKKRAEQRKEDLEILHNSMFS